MFVVIASAWNLIGGLTGYPAFGNVVYFGIGAYTVGVLVTKSTGRSPRRFPSVPPRGRSRQPDRDPLLRLRGHYFAVASLGVAVAVGEVFNNLEYFGGAVGILCPSSAPTSSSTTHAGRGGAGRRHHLGGAPLALRLRPDRDPGGRGRGRGHGVNTTLYKIAAYALSAAFTGLAGGIYAQWNVFINLDVAFNINVSIDSILMALIGGLGTIWGPVLGAIVLEFLSRLRRGGELAVLAQIGLGVLLTVAVIFLPAGGRLLRRPQLLHPRLPSADAPRERV